MVPRRVVKLERTINNLVCPTFRYRSIDFQWLFFELSHHSHLAIARHSTHVLAIALSELRLQITLLALHHPEVQDQGCGDDQNKHPIGPNRNSNRRVTKSSPYTSDFAGTRNSRCHERQDGLAQNSQADGCINYCRFVSFRFGSPDNLDFRRKNSEKINAAVWEWRSHRTTIC